MTDLRFNIPIEGDLDPGLLDEAVALLQEELSRIPDAGEPVAVPLSDGRAIGIAEVATVIAVAVPAILNVTKAIDAIIGTIEKLKKLIDKKPAKAEKSEARPIQINIEGIVVNVAGRLVPLTKLTEDDIKQLAGERSA